MELILVAQFFSLLFLTHANSSEEYHDESNEEDTGKVIKKFPYFASVQNCGAAILSDRWLVTVAHCVANPKLNLGNSAWMGGVNISSSQRVHIDKIVIHPYYSQIYRIPLNDIALLRLEKPLRFSDTIKSVKIKAAMSNYENSVILVGKKKNYLENSENTDVLMLNRLTVWECLKYIPKKYHQDLKKYITTFDRINICTKEPNDLGICLDQSGSLLMEDNVLMGLLSYGSQNNCKNNKLMFFTNVPNYVQWIKSVTGLK